MTLIPCESDVDISFMQLVRAHLSPIAFRELVEATAGWKVARVALPPSSALAVVPVLRQHGIQVAVGEYLYLHEADVGKAGWSNRLQRLADESEGVGDVYVYVAQDESLILEAADAESLGDNDGFGKTLAIPDCCRTAYEHRLEMIRNHQNDPLWSTVLGTKSTWQQHPWNNVAAQYFGYSLLSFAPCSLACEAAATMARRSLKLLAQLDPSLAQMFSRAHRSDILFSDRAGIHRLEGSRREGDSLLFTGIQSTTTTSKLAQQLQNADRIVPSSPRQFELLCGDRVVSQISADAGCGLFLCGDHA